MRGRERCPGPTSSGQTLRRSVNVVTDVHCVVRDDESLKEENVNIFMREQVSSHKQLAGGIEFVQSIPKSAAGKILRKDLKLMYEQSIKNK